MIVKAKNAVPGQRYLTKKNILVEISSAPGRPGEPPRARTRTKTGEILVHLVTDGNADYEELIPVEALYELTAVEPTGPPRKRGRKPHGPSTWRGWAYKNPQVPAKLLKIASDSGFYLTSSVNYISVGFGGKTIFTVFRSGILGFKEHPGKEFEEYGVEEHKKLRYMPYRIPAKALTQANRRDKEFIDTVKLYLSDQKQAVHKSIHELTHA